MGAGHLPLAADAGYTEKAQEHHGEPESNDPARRLGRGPART